jgi:hypothetical protein
MKAGGILRQASMPSFRGTHPSKIAKGGPAPDLSTWNRTRQYVRDFSEHYPSIVSVILAVAPFHPVAKHG